jgi:hypothetical protein
MAPPQQPLRSSPRRGRSIWLTPETSFQAADPGTTLVPRAVLDTVLVDRHSSMPVPWTAARTGLGARTI